LYQNVAIATTAKVAPKKEAIQTPQKITPKKICFCILF
jgi:hypothetical protein